ncbi:SIR2 family NAD-dependent protein deacylase [Oceanimonas baumannii]|uniref:SIR2 family protein n=1 Tax=Oceanimonas baumannii TaxID=129578 RepID=A0A235CED2_9GAMM|nr:SIR2 family protein [Oceanimonas baumannii]OYD22779.1 SIR2 family protein [Oceanimonas baumannii]TDW57746.1 SIR2-like protein [Oceanimonas baumannii]
MNKNISSIPDYTALKKLASALWQRDSSYHGAAIMIGAGFSRSAASTGDANRKLPLWNDISKVLADELDSSSVDPLRLAEEYCAYFGKQALHDLIKKEVNDAAWEPGELHKYLLELPWREVLTTNWDTLLERASTEVHHPIYSVVSKQEDLSSARSPRIVKLHGTIDITNDLVFTQEDYRKYPQHHAAFVNFSRQVFIENELCLLGFSGDDPNFLQWAGWVRDHLASHSRRIYLVGALGLNSAKRKYLESINVAPIDLYDLVADHDGHDTRHLEATEIFIQALQDLRPKPACEWLPTRLQRSALTGDKIKKFHQDPAYAAKLLEGHLPILEEDRATYPDWLVCPYGIRWQLQNRIQDPLPTPQNLAQMTADSRAKLLYEITWNYSMTYQAIPSWLAQELLTVCDPDTPCSLTKKQQLEVALLLLKNTRWMDNPEANPMTQTTRVILEKGEKYWPESSDELAYHNAIIARDKFDYSALEKHVEKITSNNPVWKLKKASLLAELGEFYRGEELVSEAYRMLLGQYRNDRNSLHILSRLAWAHWLIRGIKAWLPKGEFKAFPSHHQDQKCNPWDHIEHIRERITKDLDKQQKQHTIEPSFEPGRYKDNSNTVTFSNELHSLLIFEGVTGAVGMPIRWHGVSFLVEQAAKLVDLEGVDNIHRFSLAIRAANSDTSDVLKKVFSRVQVACLPEEDVDFLLRQCVLAIKYWSEKWTGTSGSIRNDAIDRLRVFIEVLARVSVRATPEQAKELFYLAVSLGKKPEFHHLWLFDALNHLTKFTLESIPESQHPDLLLEALSFPLQTEIGPKNYDKWANPVIKNPGKREQNTILDRRIDEIIDSISPCSSQSAPALLRLLPLIKTNFLTKAEHNKIAEKLWGTDPDYQTIPETGLLRYALLAFPALDYPAVKSLIRRYLFESEDGALFNQEFLANIANVAQAENITELPSEAQAINYFEKMVVWRPKENHNDIFGRSKQEEKQTAELIGKVLALSIVPALPSEALTKDNFTKLYDFYTAVYAPETLSAFSYFAAANATFINPVEKLIRQGLQAREANKLAQVSFALLTWRDLEEQPALNRLILRLIYLIGSNRMSGLPALLWTANQMHNKGYLSDENIGSLIEILPVIFDNTGYGDISSSNRDSVSISLVRAACVRLARDVLSRSQDKNGELLRVLEEAKQDPLPEVRFAGISDL